MNGYICFGPKGQRLEIQAATSYAAQCAAADKLKLKVKDRHKVHVQLVERGGEQVTTTITN